jgi:hypothetical protein
VSYVSSLSETQALYSPAVLAALVRDFDREPLLARRRITEFLQSEPGLFYLTAIEILKKDLDSRASQYLVTLLVQGNLLFRALCDPALDRERAIALSRQAHRGDASVDVMLARQLADTDLSGSAVAPGMGERLLEIIDQISDGKRILPSLMRMLRNDSPFLRSKVVLMIGRSGGSVAWLEKRLQESDTRVRANAIEALWGIDTADARELLQWATKDSNNRVLGNALVGLYRLGEVAPLAEIVRMAGHESAMFRRTAAWAMGETGDPRFSEVLGRMIADSNAHVRKNAFTAVRRVREAGAQVSQATQWPVAIAAHPRNPRTGERRISVSVITEDGRGLPQILPVQFVLFENGQPVWGYRVTEKMAPGPMSVLFLFPRKFDRDGKPWDQGALRCLQWKRSTDLWSSLPYAGDAAPSERPTELELPTFIANASQAARTFQETPKLIDCSGFWTAIQRGVLPSNGPRRGDRHMIVVAGEDVGAPADDSLIAAVRTSRTSIQVISTAPNPVLQDFCKRIDGRFQCVQDDASIEEAVSLAYLNLLSRYDIRYPSAADAASLKLRVHTPAGWGEAAIEL